MELLIVSGQSGSGKSTCLKILEDIGYHCIDNIPLNLLIDLIDSLDQYKKLAIGIDARTLLFSNRIQHSNYFIDVIKKITSNKKVKFNIIYLYSSEQVIVKRFNETRRKHPLIDSTTNINSIIDALKLEKSLLKPISNISNYTIDTSSMSPYDLQNFLYESLDHKQKLNLLIQSFGFKHGIPPNSNYIFDVRFVPNPYWDDELRNFSGKHEKIIKYLRSQEITNKTLKQFTNFIDFLAKEAYSSNRFFINISIGCTGGQHRSVFFVDQIGKSLKIENASINTVHRDLILSND